MATIKERAQAYRKETEKSVFKSGMDISTMEFEYAYIQGATDQRKIDVEKACEWLKKNNGKRFNGFDIVYTQGFIYEFRKAMEE